MKGRSIREAKERHSLIIVLRNDLLLVSSYEYYYVTVLLPYCLEHNLPSQYWELGVCTVLWYL
jgi:hypothetical protein